LSDDADRDQPVRDLSTWTVDRLEAFATTRQGEELECVRVVAQSHVYRSDEPPDVRLRWAKLSLNANERLPDGGPWSRARKTCQNFALRTWIIGHLGPDTDPDWRPDVVAADTLAALTLDPGEAAALSRSWCDLPVGRIGELRRHKNMTAHLDQLLGHLPPGPDRDRLLSWTEVREHLP
jgi:hypothetical protein